MEPLTISEYFDILGKSQKIYGKYLEPVCRKWALTRNELDVLLFLFNNPGFDRAADIAARRGIAKSHVSLSVTSLEGRGLILRQFTPEDRRTAHLRLTPEGAAAAREGREVQKAFFVRLYADVTSEELAMWKKTNEKVRKNIENLEEEP